MQKANYGLIIILAIILTLFLSMPVLADETDINAEILALQESGIITGDPDGNLRPNDELTRAEFATILCRAIGVDDQAQSLSMINKNYFSDVPSGHWAEGYINTAVEYQAINGFADGTFRPELTVTNEQVIKMLVAAWGYGEQAENLGGYPDGYMEIAQTYGLTDTVLFNYGVASKRWVACSFTCGALNMPAAADADLDIPEINQSVKAKAARPENTDYIADPISILKRITPQSAKYERTLFEQKVPEDYMPFILQENRLTTGSATEKAKITITVPGGKETVAEGYFQQGVFDLSALPFSPDPYSLTIVLTDGAIQDNYYATIVSGSNGFWQYSGSIFRYTHLNVQRQTTETAESITAGSADHGETYPFALEALYNQAGRPMLRVSYLRVLAEDDYWQTNINTMTDPVYHPPFRRESAAAGDNSSLFRPIMGTNAVPEAMIADDLQLNIDYNIQLSVGYARGNAGSTALKGIIRFFERDGALDYVFEGNIQDLTVDSYEIRNY